LRHDRIITSAFCFYFPVIYEVTNLVKIGGHTNLLWVRAPRGTGYHSIPTRSVANQRGEALLKDSSPLPPDEIRPLALKIVIKKNTKS